MIVPVPLPPAVIIPAAVAPLVLGTVSLLGAVVVITRLGQCQAAARDEHGSGKQHGSKISKHGKPPARIFPTLACQCDPG